MVKMEEEEEKMEELGGGGGDGRTAHLMYSFAVLTCYLF